MGGTTFKCRIPKPCHNTSAAFPLAVLQRCTANTLDDIMRYHTCAQVDSSGVETTFDALLSALIWSVVMMTPCIEEFVLKYIDKEQCISGLFRNYKVMHADVL